MEINPKKTKILVLCKKKKAKKLNIKQVAGRNIQISSGRDRLFSNSGELHITDKEQDQNHLNIPKLLINTVSIKTRLGLWRVYCSSNLTYACGILAMNPRKIKEFGRLYIVTLKNACKLHRNSKNNLVLRVLKVWHS